MEPMTMGAMGIAAGGQLLGKLLSNAAARKELAEKRQLEAAKMGHDSQMKGLQTQGQGVQQGYQQLGAILSRALL